VAAQQPVAKEPTYQRVDLKGFLAYRVGRLLRFKLSEVEGTTGHSNDFKPTASGRTTESMPVGRTPTN